MTDQELRIVEPRIIEHSLGLTKRCGRRPRWSHRNYYDAFNLDRAIVDDMVLHGLMARRGVSTGLIWYAVTRKGAELAGLLNRVTKQDLAAAGRPDPAKPRNAHHDR